MKKIRFVILFLLLASMLTLTSCRVNWFGESYDVPWYVVAIPTLIFCCIAFFAAGRCIAKKLYVCPKCGHKGFCSVSRKSDEE